jgi:hypothetical protein
MKKPNEIVTFPDKELTIKSTLNLQKNPLHTLKNRQIIIKRHNKSPINHKLTFISLIKS